MAAPASARSTALALAETQSSRLSSCRRSEMYFLRASMRAERLSISRLEHRPQTVPGSHINLAAIRSFHHSAVAGDLCDLELRTIEPSASILDVPNLKCGR